MTIQQLSIFIENKYKKIVHGCAKSKNTAFPAVFFSDAQNRVFWLFLTIWTSLICNKCYKFLQKV